MNLEYIKSIVTYGFEIEIDVAHGLIIGIVKPILKWHWSLHTAAYVADPD